MVRSMWSGVAGMKSHQTRMDTIGNNIANVNTYGFKSSRVTFRDVYYQSMRSGSAGTGTKGGLNPSQIGYGSTVGSVDVLHTQSIMSSTGNPLDVAIQGEGFFQVQDGDGNTFYTKAGMLDIDSYGNLIDTNGNFVLGVSGKPVGKAPGSNRIQLNIPSVDPSAGMATDTFNSIKYTIKASNNTSESNVTMNFTPATDLPIGQPVEAIITSTGINVRLNSKEVFADINDLQTKVNAAIKAANGGVEHPAGTFTIEMDPATKFQNLTGAEIAGSEFGIKPGTVPMDTDWAKLFSVTTTGEKFSGAAAPAWNVAQTVLGDPTATPPTENKYEIKVTIDGKEYKADLLASQMKSPGSVLLTSGTDADTITIGYPSETSLLAKCNGGTPAAGVAADFTDFNTLGAAVTALATPATESKDLGLGGRPFRLEGGTIGGAQTVNDLSGIAIGSDGVIVGTHSKLGELELGRIDLVTFANTKGLAQSGNTYFSSTPASGTAKAVKAGESGSGALASSSLEMSNVDLSQEFSDMITTQRGFQANSRLITVSDTMLEELINLKR